MFTDYDFAGETEVEDCGIKRNCYRAFIIIKLVATSTSSDQKDTRNII